MTDNVQFQVDPGQKFRALIDKVTEESTDLTIPFISITKSWFKSNHALSNLRSAGKYVDLKPKTKKQKLREVGHVYPVLFRSGAMLGSITMQGSADSISEIANKTSLVLGTRNPYAPFHQFGTSRLPVRPIVFTGAEQTAPGEISNRQAAWFKIFENFYEQLLAKRNS